MDPFIGEIILFGGNFAPRSWAFCNGQLLAISSNEALFSILGTTYGGDGRTTFALPDLRGRSAVSSGSGPGLNPYTLGQRGGSEQNQITTNQMPAHTHAKQGDVIVGVNEEDPDSEEGNGKVLGNTPSGNIIYNGSAAGANITLGGVSSNLTVVPQGGSQMINNEQPYQVLNYIICLYGVFPSRN